jgi:hypothetical protein
VSDEAERNLRRAKRINVYEHFTIGILIYYFLGKRSKGKEAAGISSVRDKRNVCVLIAEKWEI